MSINYESPFEADRAQQFYDDLFAASPPLPVEPPDISAIRERFANDVATEPGYAWERVTAWLADIRDVRDDGDGPILILDLCSSLPFMAARGRASEFSRSALKAREIVSSSLLHESAIGNLASEEAEFVSVAKILARDEHARQLLVAAIQETIYGLTIEEWQDESILQSHLLARLARQQNFYIPDARRDNQDIEAGWGLRFLTRSDKQNYAESLCAYEVPTEDAETAGQLLRDDENYGSLMAIASDRKASKTDRQEAKDKISDSEDPNYNELRERARSRKQVSADVVQHYIAWQAGVIARSIVSNPKCRPIRFLSMDMASADEIASSSFANTPLETQKMNIFAHAVDSLYNPMMHIRGNILEELPVPDDSVTLMTLYDGWPFWVSEAASEGVDHDFLAAQSANTLLRLHSKLSNGGQLIIFPWAIHDSDMAVQAALDDATDEMGFQTGQGFVSRRFAKRTLYSWMSAGDRAISERSPIFQIPGNSVSALTITRSDSYGDSVLHNAGLPFARIAGGDGSALLPSIEGWPFWTAEGLSDDTERHQFESQAVETLLEIYLNMNPGEQLIIFPWSVHNGDSADQAMLDNIADELAFQAGHGVDYLYIDKRTYAAWLLARAQVHPSDVSAVLQMPGNSIRALLVTRQRESLLRYKKSGNVAKVAGELVMRDQSQD